MADITPLLIPSAIRFSIVLIAAWAATALMHRSSASTRHFLWVCAITVGALVQAGQIVGPAWQVPTPVALQRHASTLVRRETSLPREALLVEHQARAADSPARSSSTNRYGVMITRVWAAGVLATLGWFAIAYISAWRLRRSARPLGGVWAEEAAAMARAFGIRAPVRVGESPHTAVPIVFGFARPMVVVPSRSIGSPRERLRVVLLHEVAHIARRDCVTQAVAQVVCAAYWFDPLAWVASRRLHIERERACDDIVVASGVKGSDYAEHLLDIARAGRPRRPPAYSAALSMAICSQLEGRLMSILDPRTRRASSGWTRLATLATLVLLGVPVATATVYEPQTRNQSWNGSVWQWNDALTPGHIFALYGATASIRAVRSTDERVYVEARRRGGRDVPIKIINSARGTTVCFDGCASDQRPSRRWNHLLGSVLGRQIDVEVTVRVPAGVRFSGGSVAGDIAVQELQGDIGVNTVAGNVVVRDTPFSTRIQTVDGDVTVDVPLTTEVTFTAKTISGTIKSAVPISSNRPRRRGAGADVNAAAVPTLHVVTIGGDISVRRR